MPGRKYSIIVWGATGFTGKLVAEYLTVSAPKDITFAIAGRNGAKLESIVQHFKHLKPALKNVGVIIADSADEASLDAMTKQADVVISTVGPYIKYGFPLVDACVRNSTDYVDLTGEPTFVKQTILNYHEKASAKGVSIVHSCGFDSIPSDLGVFLLADHFKSKGLALGNARLQVRGAAGATSGGTVASFIELVGNTSLKELKELGSNPNYLVPGKPKGNAWGPTVLYYDYGLKSYQTPFVMEGTNSKIVRRTNSLLGYNNQEFQYCEGVKASNILLALLLTIGNALLGLLLLLPPSRWLIGKVCRWFWRMCRISSY
jgi:short subunit dehydrogenase-like uncharacterized protein